MNSVRSVHSRLGGGAFDLSLELAHTERGKLDLGDCCDNSSFISLDTSQQSLNTRKRDESNTAVSGQGKQQSMTTSSRYHQQNGNINQQVAQAHNGAVSKHQHSDSSLRGSNVNSHVTNKKVGKRLVILNL